MTDRDDPAMRLEGMMNPHLLGARLIPQVHYHFFTTLTVRS